MSYSYKIVELNKSKYPTKSPFEMVPEFLVIHNTDNDASAENEIAYMQRNDNKVSFHIAVDDKYAIQGLPLDRSAYHAGDGNGEGNRKGIAIEICYSLSGGERFLLAQDNAAMLAASMLSVRGWDISRVKKHQDFSGKYCPRRTMDELGWDNFLAKISDFMNKGGDKTMRYFKLKEDMNMRSTPNGTIIDSVPEGTIISGTEFLQNRGIDWVKTVFNGKTGYVAVLPASTNYATEISKSEAFPQADFETLYNAEKARADSLQEKLDAIKNILD